MTNFYEDISKINGIFQGQHCNLCSKICKFFKILILVTLLNIINLLKTVIL